MYRGEGGERKVEMQEIQGTWSQEFQNRKL